MHRINSNISDGMNHFATNSQMMESSEGQVILNSQGNHMNNSKHALLNLVQDSKTSSQGAKNKQTLAINIGSTIKKPVQRDLIKVSSKSSFHTSQLLKQTPQSTKTVSIVYPSNGMASTQNMQQPS